MRRYLLGTLGGPEARAVEERYFADPSFLRFVEFVEDGLIQDYVDARLSEEDRRRFERRYLAVEELRQKVEARSRAAASTRVQTGFPYRYAFAAVCLLIAVAAVWLQRNSQGPAQLRLRPGVLMGSDAAIEWDLSAGAARLLLELPGAPLDPARARVSSVSADGSLHPVWESKDLHPHRGAAVTEYEVEVPAQSLRAGDYLLSLLAPDGAAETYAFRVRASH